MGAEFFDITPPYVPGGGVAGTVTATGEGADTVATTRRGPVPSVTGRGGVDDRT